MDEKFACFLLSVSDQMGTKSIDSLKSYTGSYSDSINTDPELFFREKLINKAQYAGLLKTRHDMNAHKKYYEQVMSHGVHAVIREEAEYPERLRNIPYPPVILFYRGSLPEDSLPSASVIGARNCSDYGISAARFFAGELAVNGVQIVSGMAYGIDSAAASGALSVGGKSYAVLGSGVNICYPKESYSLYKKMAGISEASCGGIISEFHPAAEALPSHFAMRNRIIAGLGDVLIVIEAKDKSGTFITVDHALSQGKDVFALPGRITDPLGRGCNKLLKDGALPLTEPEDVLSYLGIDKDNSVSFPEKDISSLSAKCRMVYAALSAEPMHIEQIAARLSVDIPELIVLLENLEIYGFAVSTANAYWRRSLD